MNEKKELIAKNSKNKKSSAKPSVVAQNTAAKKNVKAKTVSKSSNKTSKQAKAAVLDEKVDVLSENNNNIAKNKKDTEALAGLKEEKTETLQKNKKVSSEKHLPAKNARQKNEKRKKEKKSKDKKEKKPLTKKQIILISSISAAVLVAILAVVLCLVLIKPAKAPDYPTLSAIEVKVASKTTGYKAFDQFDDDGLILKATYSDESTKEILEGWTISYISQSGETETMHSDHFYGGETKVKINYLGRTCYLMVDEVEKIESDLQITLERHSQIQTGEVINLPSEKLKITNDDGDSVAGASYELVYCKTFNSVVDYELTSSEDGSQAEGGAPKKVGTYKVFAKLLGDKNYFDKLSDVVELNIVDETQTGLFAQSSEDFFAWKEQVIPVPTDPSYVEFELVTDNNGKNIKFYSTFAGSGFAYIYSDGIELICDNEKTQISLENNEISIKNSQTTLKKWNIPAYLGVYERIVTPEYVADNFHLTLAEEETCKLDIYIDDTQKDGKVYFSYDLLWRNGETLSMQRIEGFVTYSKSQSGIGNLAFNVINEDVISNLFTISGISENDRLSVIEILIQGVSEAAVSNGEYQRVS